MVTRAVTSVRVGSGQGLGRGNTAIRVIGTERIDRRLNAIARRQAQYGRILQQAIRALVREVLRRVPYVTGRLYRSFRVNVTANYITLSFNTVYANRVNEESRRNARYFQRGLRAGITAANATRRQSPDGVIGARFQNMGIRRIGNGNIEARVSYRGLSSSTLARRR